jgi:hypothetical protein
MCGFPTRGAPKLFAASDVSSVIALEKSENKSKQAADERTRKRQFADIMRVVLRTLVFVGASRNCGKESLPPSHFEPRVASSRNIMIHNPFVAALTPSPTRAPISQPDPDSRMALLNKLDTSMDRRG